MSEESAAIAERYAPNDSDRKIAHPLKRLWSKPLLPEAGAAGAPLTAVIAVISFLAALALAGFLVITSATMAWTDALRASFTIQVKGADAAAIDQSMTAVKRVLDTTDGVAAYEIMPSEDAAKLLEPWLGKSNIPDYLNVPALITVDVEESLRRDMSLLKNRLSAAAPNAVVDDHQAWRDRLAAAARSGQMLAFGVFSLIVGAACAVAIFAARAGLAANEHVVSLLHLVGATDQFIANEVQRRFMILGARGSAIGLLAAITTLAIFGLSAQSASGDQFFLPGFDFTAWLAFSLLSVPIAICLVIAIAARMTVLSALRATY